MPGEDQKIVFLNWMVSRSTTRKHNVDPPTVAMSTLLEILGKRMVDKSAIEFPNIPSQRITDDQDDVARIREGAGYSFIRLSDIKIIETEHFKYATLLLKHVDATSKGFSVEDMFNFAGREIAGTDSERAVTSAHVGIRLPLSESQFDDGKYRCTVDAVSPLTRSAIERFLCRQIHRTTKVEKWTFPVTEQKARAKRPTTKEYEYTPRLELLADVGRTLPVADAGGELSSMVFTKRAERKSINDGTTVHHTEFLANVEMRISGNQAPTDPDQRRTWMQDIRAYFASLGYDAKIYYKHQNGSVVGGGVHHALESATDMVMCPKAFITVTDPIEYWKSNVNPHIEAAMRELLDKDELWEQKR